MLSLAFLGTFHVSRRGVPIQCFRTQSVRALLAYLAIESDRPHERAFLANLLWPDTPLEQAQAVLRQSIHRLRCVLNTDSDGEYLEIARYAVRFLPHMSEESDLHRFDRLIEGVRYVPGYCEQIGGDVASRLREAVGLHRGEVLAGFSGMGSQPFEEWLLLLRERTHNRLIQALDMLSKYYSSHGDIYCAGEYLRHWLVLEPWRELAHRRLMLLLAQNGRRVEALQQFERCCIVLEREFNLRPTCETLRLAESIRNDEIMEWSLERAELVELSM